MDFPARQGRVWAWKSPSRMKRAVHLPFSRWQCFDRATSGALADSSVSSGQTMEDIVTAKLDYATLDDRRLAGAPPAEQHGDSGAEHWRPRRVERSRNHLRARRKTAPHVRGATCILACWNMVIPYLCPEFAGKAERSARLWSESSHSCTPTCRFAIGSRSKNWASAQYAAPEVISSRSRSIFRSAWANTNLRGIPASRACCIWKACRAKRVCRHASNNARVAWSFYTTQLCNFRAATSASSSARCLLPADSILPRDIQAITVNRWPHGYAYEYNSLVRSRLARRSAALRRWPAAVRTHLDCKF